MFKLTKLITAAEGADRSKLEAALNGAAKAPGRRPLNAEPDPAQRL